MNATPRKNSLSRSPVAQLVERAAVNRYVLGSSPSGGALLPAVFLRIFKILGKFRLFVPVLSTPV